MPDLPRPAWEETPRVAKALDGVFEHLSNWLHPGLTDKDVSAYCGRLLAEQQLVPTIAESHDGHAALVSINSTVLGATPSGRELRAGDLVTIESWVKGEHAHAQKAWSYVVGCSPHRRIARFARVLVDVLVNVASSIEPGQRSGDIGSKFQKIVADSGYSVVRHMGGFAMGPDRVVQDKLILGSEEAGTGWLVATGDVLCLQVVATLGKHHVQHALKGGGVRTRDHSVGAAFSIIVRVTPSGSEVVGSFPKWTAHGRHQDDGRNSLFESFRRLVPGNERARDLVAAIRNDDRNRVEVLLQQGANANSSRYCLTGTPLCEAIVCGHVDIVRILAEHGAVFSGPVALALGKKEVEMAGVYDDHAAERTLDAFLDVLLDGDIDLEDILHHVRGDGWGDGWGVASQRPILLRKLKSHGVLPSHIPPRPRGAVSIALEPIAPFLEKLTATDKAASQGHRSDRSRKALAREQAKSARKAEVEAQKQQTEWEAKAKRRMTKYIVIDPKRRRVFEEACPFGTPFEQIGDKYGIDLWDRQRLAPQVHVYVDGSGAYKYPHKFLLEGVNTGLPLFGFAVVAASSPFQDGRLAPLPEEVSRKFILRSVRWQD